MGGIRRHVSTAKVRPSLAMTSLFSSIHTREVNVASAVSSLVDPHDLAGHQWAALVAI